jgi:hypothetical protein
MYAVSDNGHVYAFRESARGSAVVDVVLTSVVLIAILFVMIVSVALYRWRRGRRRA